ncbi:MAG: FHA domain-containing protein [Acidimicrobiia bacterium]|nr:FHA domain-containing protein [Acidimicrobiia bacterium]NNL27386.1 DUF3662 domain-containing protein [Acidimicrobiia bacterium]
MAIARSLERKIERLVEGVGARLFGGGLDVLEVASRIVREADLNVTHDAVGPVVPNHFDVFVADGEASSSAQLNEVVEEAARENGWRLKGPADVVIIVDANMSAGSVAIESTTVPGHRAAWAYLESARDQRRIPIRMNRALIGRSRSADVVLADLEVSRGQAILWTEQGAVWLYDIGSANGTAVNGRPITDATRIADGDLLTFGLASFRLRTT